jgi:hypothetical protein
MTAFRCFVQHVGESAAGIAAATFPLERPIGCQLNAATSVTM